MAVPTKSNRTYKVFSQPKEATQKFIKYWFPVIIYAIFIFNVSAKAGEEIPLLFTYQDVVFHIIEYAGFALLLNRALKAYSIAGRYSRRVLWVFFIAVIYAIADEYHQSFVPQRNCSLVDVAYDSIGICLANIFYR